MRNGKDREVIEVRNLRKYFPVKTSLFGKVLQVLKAVDGISFTIKKGEVLALVGESGCGKSTTGRILVGLESPTDGELFFKGEPLVSFKDKKIRKNIQMIFQDPYASLNPKMRIGEALAEGLYLHFPELTKKEVEDKVLSILRRIGLTPERIFFERYPHELSGGQKQRVVIARAMLLEPEFVVADEPISMIDLSLRASILELLEEFRREMDISMLFISHDFSIAKIISDNIAVMYLGNIVELGPMKDVIENPKHPYTLALLSAIPTFGEKRFNLKIKGDIPNPLNPPSGCKFHPRCPFAQKICSEEAPHLKKIDNQEVLCHFPL